MIVCLLSYRSNSHFAIGHDGTTKLFDISPIFKSPVGRFQTKPLNTLKVYIKWIAFLIAWLIYFYDNFI